MVTITLYRGQKSLHLFNAADDFDRNSCKYEWVVVKTGSLRGKSLVIQIYPGQISSRGIKQNQK